MIEDYIPHRAAACMIDRLVTADADHAETEADVSPRGMLVQDGVLPAWAGIELMAQTVAAWSGARARAEGRPVPIGYLLGTRRYEAFCDGFAAGRTLRINARPDFVATTGMGMFSCSIHDGTTLLAQAQIAVYEPAATEAANQDG